MLAKAVKSAFETTIGQEMTVDIMNMKDYVIHLVVWKIALDLRRMTACHVLQMHTSTKTTSVFVTSIGLVMIAL